MKAPRLGKTTFLCFKTMTLEQQRRSERLAQRRSGASKNSVDQSDVRDEELASITDSCPRSPPTPPLSEESEKDRATHQQLSDRAVVSGSIFAALGVLAAVLWIGVAPLRAYTIVLNKTIHIAPDFVMAALCASWSAGLLYAIREVHATKSE